MKESKDSFTEDKKRLAAYILSEVPQEAFDKLNVDFDGKVRLLGARVEPKNLLKPDQEVRLTLYWRSDKPLGPGFGLFTHVLDGAGASVHNLDNVGPLRKWNGKRQALPPSAWEPGKVYVDEQSFRVPKSFKSAKLRVVTGIFKGDERMNIVSGRHDGARRAAVTTLRVLQLRPRLPNTRVPELSVPKLEPDGKLTIDGKLDEAAWQRAAVAGPFVDVNTGERNTSFPVNGSVKLLWDDRALYLGFEVEDEEVIGDFDEAAVDPQLWTKDTVEIMIDPEGDGDNVDYYEIQINPQNLVFDSRFDRYNEPRKPDGPFGHQDWKAQLKSAVTVQGTLNQAGDRDQGYRVEASIAWSSFTKAKKPVPTPGDVWRANFYAIQNNSGVAWSPILRHGNFHKASRFGKLVFADRETPVRLDLRNRERRPIVMDPKGVQAPFIRRGTAGGAGVP